MHLASRLLVAVAVSVAAIPGKCWMQPSRSPVLQAVLFDQLVLAGSMSGTLNLTLQLTTADFLPVRTILHAAAEAWVSALNPQPW